MLVRLSTIIALPSGKRRWSYFQVIEVVHRYHQSQVQHLSFLNLDLQKIADSFSEGILLLGDQTNYRN